MHTSDATASVRSRVGGQFLEIAYTWSYEDKLQEGVLIFGGDNSSDAVNAFWTDSWHMAHQVMMCSGRSDANGTIDINGHYKVEGHPDWGWRTEVIPGDGKFQYRMFNVSPEGDEQIAVEMEMQKM